MVERATCTDLAFFRRFPGSGLLPHAIRLLAAGQPVRVDQVAAVADVPPDEVASLLHSQPGTDWDAQGRLIGFGLTQRPTAHRLVVAGRPLFTWCAMDTLLFPMLLGEPATAESRCPVTGRTIRVELDPEAVRSVDPERAVVSQVGVREVGDVRGEVCDHGHFFASAEAARPWATEHPNGRVLSVHDAFDQARLSWRAAEAEVR
jgi:alkylmercury lyase